MSLETNGAFAKAALQFVRGHIKEAWNWKNVTDSNEKELKQLAVSKLAEVTAPPGALAQLQNKDICMHDYLMHTAGVILQKAQSKEIESGSCGLQSTLAYKHLVEIGAKGISYLLVVDGNHEFLVVGSSEPAYFGQQRYEMQVPRLIAPINHFGPDAVVCDPWFKGGCFFPVRDWRNWFPAIMAETCQPGLDNCPTDQFFTLKLLAHHHG
jgi:hypothetical protein